MTFFNWILRINLEMRVPAPFLGGRKKTYDQIKDLPHSYLAVDDLEVGAGNKIPLWLFGFLY